MSDDIKTASELKLRWPVFLVIFGLFLAGVNAGIFVWKATKVAPPPIAVAPKSTELKEVHPPKSFEEDKPLEVNESVYLKWGNAFPHKQVPGKKSLLENPGSPSEAATLTNHVPVTTVPKVFKANDR